MLTDESLTAVEVTGDGGSRFLRNGPCSSMALRRPGCGCPATSPASRPSTAGRSSTPRLCLALGWSGCGPGWRIELRLRGELLADILGGAAIDSRSVRERADRLGHDLTASHVAIVGQGNGDRPAARRARRTAVVERRDRHRRPLPPAPAGRAVSRTTWWPCGRSTWRRPSRRFLRPQLPASCDGR